MDKKLAQPKFISCFKRAGILLIVISTTSLQSKQKAIKLRDRVTVHSLKKISIAEVLVDRDRSSLRDPAFSRIKLLDPPELGGRKNYTNGEMAHLFRKLRKEHKSLKGINFIIPKNILVENHRSKWSKRNVKQKLISQLKIHCGTCHFVFEKLSIPIITASYRNQNWKINPLSSLPKGRFSLPVTFEDQHGKKRNFWVNGQLKIKQKVPILSRALARGTGFKPENVLWKWRDVTFATDTTPLKEKILQSESSQSMRAGDIIWYSKISKRKVLQYGDPVNVSIGESSWTVSTEGIAQSSGGIGDEVTVKIIATNQKVKGTLIGKGQVKIQ